MPALKLESKHLVLIACALCITILEAAAIVSGRDGVFFSGTLALLGSIVGAAVGIRVTRPQP